MDPSSPALGHGPALLRLLARIGADAPPASPPLSARLAQWIDWRHAVALSAALEPRTPSPCTLSASFGDGPDEAARVQALVAGLVDTDRAFGAGARTDAPATAPPAEPAFYRQRYVALQQVMEAEVGLARKRLRQRLATQGPDPARLAAMDAALEQALAARERAALAVLADALARHFERLRAEAPEAATPAWHAAFRRDARALLLAELDFRLLPVHGLLAALRTPRPGSHAP